MLKAVQNSSLDEPTVLIVTDCERNRYPKSENNGGSPAGIRSDRPPDMYLVNSDISGHRTLFQYGNRIGQRVKHQMLEE
jgi:hypothetical protein